MPCLDITCLASIISSEGQEELKGIELSRSVHEARCNGRQAGCGSRNFYCRKDVEEVMGPGRVSIEYSCKIARAESKQREDGGNRDRLTRPD